jgi:hypothetical protein
MRAAPSSETSTVAACVMARALSLPVVSALSPDRAKGTAAVLRHQ